MKTTLVLNKDWVPVNVFPFSAISWKEAVNQILVHQSEPIHFYENWTVSSPSISVQVPSVVVLRRAYVRTRKKLPPGSSTVFLRDNYTCQYCGATDVRLTKDHILPTSKGGHKHSLLNIVTCCESCNLLKGNDMTVVPKIMPHIPTTQELMQKIRRHPTVVPHASWIPYIGWSPKLVTVIEPSGLPGYGIR